MDFLMCFIGMFESILGRAVLSSVDETEKLEYYVVGEIERKNVEAEEIRKAA